MNFTELENRNAMVSRIPPKYQSLPYIYIAQAEWEADEGKAYKFGISMNRQGKDPKQGKTNFSTRVCQTAQGLKPCWVYYLLFYNHETLPDSFAKGRDGKRYVVHYIESAMKYYFLKDNALWKMKRPTKKNPNFVALGEFIVNRNYHYVSDVVYALLRTPNDIKFHGNPEQWNTNRQTDTITDQMDLPTPVFGIKATNKSVFSIQPSMNDIELSGVLYRSFFEPEVEEENAFSHGGYISQRLPTGYEIDESLNAEAELRYKKGQFVLLPKKPITADNYRGVELKDWFLVYQITGTTKEGKLNLILYKSRSLSQAGRQESLKGILERPYLPVWRNPKTGDEIQADGLPSKYKGSKDFEPIRRTVSKDDVVNIRVSRNRKNELSKATRNSIRSAFYQAKITAHRVSIGNGADKDGNVVFNENEDEMLLFQGDILMEGFKPPPKPAPAQQMASPALSEYDEGNLSPDDELLAILDDELLAILDKDDEDESLSTTDDELPPPRKYLSSVKEQDRHRYYKVKRKVKGKLGRRPKKVRFNDEKELDALLGSSKSAKKY